MSPVTAGADARRKPVFDPTINLGHVLTALAMLAAGFATYSSLDKRVVVLEERAAASVQQTQEQRAEQREASREMRTDIKDIQRSLNDINRALNVPNRRGT
jgi:uncharacterized protein HemX